MLLWGFHFFKQKTYKICYKKMKKQLLLIISVLIAVQGMAQMSFIERLGNESPFGLPHIFSERSFVELVDIDNDGDYDLFTSGNTGGFQFYENVGTPSVYDYVQRTGSDNPLDNVITIMQNSPVGYIHFHDVDGDGDFDFAYPDRTNDVFVYFENVGSVSAPSFIHRTGSDNPYNSITFTNLQWNAWTGDLNNDGYTDVINQQSIYLGNGNGFDAPIQMLYFVEEVVDFDGDGDNDLVIRKGGNPEFAYMRNIGSNANMNFVDIPNSLFERIRTLRFNPPGIDLGASICMKDIDHDGDIDLLKAEVGANIMSLYDNIGTPTFPVLSQRNDFQDFFYGFTVTKSFEYTLADINGDNLLDMTLSNVDFYSGTSNYDNLYFKNEGGLNAPKFKIQMVNDNALGATNPFANLNLFSMFFKDFDGDNDLDLVDYGHNNTINLSKYYENIGTSTNPNYQEQLTNVFTTLGPVDIGDFVDIDNDGDYDFLNGQEFYLFNAVTQSYVSQPNPIYAPNSRITFVDIDQDGDYDCFAATNHEIYYYKNDGDATTANFALSTDNPFGGLNLGLPKPKLIFGDVDIDGDIDMFVMDTIQIMIWVPISIKYNYLRYFENQTIYTNTQMPQATNIQNLVIAPNPNNGQFVIEIPESLQQGKFLMQVFDLTGRKVLERTVQNSSNKLEFNELQREANGLYLIVIQNKDAVYQAKVLKE
jgi:hypothetical protein